MDVPLISTIANHLAQSGHAALRFNFGGVGASGGMFTDGNAEAQDVAAAFAFLQAQPEVDAKSVALGGWSFGSWMAITALADGVAARALSAIAPPLIVYDWQGMADRMSASSAARYYIAGDDDEYCPADLLHQFAAAVSPEDDSHVTILPGANHFLSGREREVATLVAREL